ncbi:MAG: penicillin-binding protein 1C [Bacteroidia bacterium]
MHRLKNILSALRARRKKILWGIGIFILASYLLFKLLDNLYPLNTDRLSYSTVVLSSDGSIMSAFLSKDDKWRIQIRKEDIPEGLKKAFIFKEDKYFFLHPGVNLFALARAFFQDIRAGKVVSGASTVTMQVARMLSPERRSFYNKFKEIFRALQLESHFSKEEILEMYFNLLPYGGNVEGIKAASLIYLHKLPIDLSPAEIATLMIVPNSPRHYRFDNNNGAIIAGRNKWLERFGKAKLFKDREIEQAISEPLYAKRIDIPRIAPQFCIELARKYKGTAYIQTNIDLNMQKKAQNVLTEYVQKLTLWNITNAAVLIVRNKDHAVMAYVSSANFDDMAHQGQVDGVDAIRSPGSALKPFLYALAFDQGLATPKTILYDVPSNFNGYQPQDYDRIFRGKVTVEDALLNSLNVPAVKMLSNMDIATYINVLENGGCHSLVSQQQKLGLSLVLGGCGIKLKELTGLYVTLANGGQYAPLRYTKDQPEIKPVQLLSKESSFMISHILTEMERTDVPANMDDAEHFPKIAWKTGTSYGHHDGWCVGYNDKYTVGVWVGNFNAAESPELSGASCAVPLMTQLFSTLNYYNDFNWLKFPPHVGVRWVCSETGKIPNTWCNNLVPDYYIPGVSSTETCEHMKMVYTDAKGTISYCRSCLPKAGYVEKLYPSYSPEMIAYFELYKIPYVKIPPHNPKCPRVYSDRSLAIQSPVNGMQYLLMKNESHNIMLKCNAGNDVSTIYWYVNDKYYGKTKPDESLFFSPDAGNVKVSCTDDKGRTAHVRISVKEI